MLPQPVKFFFTLMIFKGVNFISMVLSNVPLLACVKKFVNQFVPDSV